MPAPSQVHVNQPLTDLSVAVVQAESKFVADKMFPAVRVKKQGDLYYVYTQADFLTDGAKQRAPGSESAGGDYGLSTDTYFCTKYAFHKDVSDEERLNADSALQPDEDAMRFIVQKLLIRRELLFAQTFLKSSVWTTSVKGGAKDANPAPNFVYWSDYDNSHPIDDVESWAAAVEKNTGFRPNRMLIGAEVMPVLKSHPDVLNRVKYTQRGVITTDLLASLFGVEQVFVASAIYSNQGSYDYTCPAKSILLVYAPPNPGLRTPSAGYHFVWTGLPGVNELGYRILKFRIDERLSDRIEGEIAFCPKLVAADLGAFAEDVIA